ncbi:effector-associated domain EAD1-containing protein [Paucibacter sp. B2R-40]|uniref:GAP1-N1 domain-containing protein n=1 Tax=Paucibacter sp. B2R-40 TaxID=2893554 RepID=UPI0021E36333|nr:effector-associated domain EAD1-containing protein [Paucibacter sp. B2R-40]MCV2354564.1 effector-associated domain EAD1-containing protein [Paucibacter sp. B2R-40]
MMIIQQAIYGVSTGHALLRCSDNTLFKVFNEAAWLTDLPATCPYGITWAPFFRMVRLDDWMFFVHTRPDAEAKRGGMVLSRAALIPLSLIGELHDLSHLAANLQEPWTPEVEIRPLSFPESVGRISEAQVPPLTAAIAHWVMRDPNRPAVVFQQDGLDEALFELWRRVPSEFRSKLTFGLSFSPGDVEQANVVFTPKELASRWDPSQIVDPEHGLDVDGHVATVLDLQLDQSVRDFASRVSLPLDSANSISYAIQASELWHVKPTPASDVKLLRILVEVARPSSGASEARALVTRRLAAAHATWPQSVVMQMRNLDLTSVEGADEVELGIQTWVTARAVSTNQEGLLEVLAAWLTDKPRPPWKDSVKTGLAAALARKSISDDLFRLTWQAIKNDPSRAPRGLSILHGAVHEKQLTACVDHNLSLDIAEQILPTALSMEWWLLAGTLLARSRSTVDALRAAVVAAPSTKAARKSLISSSLSNAGPIELVDAAIAVRDPIAMQLAGQEAEKDRSVLLGFDWMRFEWFEVFKAAYDLSPNVIDALPNRVDGMGQMIAAQMAAQAIWQVVAATPLADLSEVADRQRAWDLIPVHLVDGILAVTARGWLARFEQGHVSAADLDPRLAPIVSGMARRPDYVLDALRREPASLPRFLADFPFATDADAFRFLTGLKATELRLAEASSKALGQAFVVNDWGDAARGAVYWMNARQDLRPMYRECISLVSIFDRLWVSWELGMSSPLTVDQAWEAFATEAAHLYPTGPWHDAIWSRSGGDEGDLVYQGTGKATWHRCIQDLRNGMAPGADAVLKRMIEELPHNNTLKQLQQQRFWR